MQLFVVVEVGRIGGKNAGKKSAKAWRFRDLVGVLGRKNQQIISKYHGTDDAQDGYPPCP